MEEIVEHSEDESDSEDSYVDGIYFLQPQVAVLSVHCSVVSFHSDIPEAEFPEYVRLMHEDRDHRLELEYRVCLHCRPTLTGVHVSVCLQSLDKLPQPPSDAARFPCNIGHNRFKNIFPCE